MKRIKIDGIFQFTHDRKNVVKTTTNPKNHPGVS